MSYYDFLIDSFHGGVDPYASIGDGPVSDFGWNLGDPFLIDTFELMKPAIPRLVIEVGTFHGASARHFAAHMPDNGIVLCVDTFCGDHEHWIHNRDKLFMQHGRANFYEVFLRTNKKHGLHRKIIPIPMDSFSAARYIQSVITSQGAQGSQGGITKADVIYIDGSHEYEMVRLDIQSYLPLLHPGGYMIFDDYPRDGISRAVAEKWPRRGTLSPDGTKLRLQV